MPSPLTDRHPTLPTRTCRHGLLMVDECPMCEMTRPVPPTPAEMKRVKA